MNSKKGFTLVELLTVIVLIGLLIGIGVPGVIKISDRMKDRSYNTKVNLVEQAAILWGQDNKTRLQTHDNCKIDGEEYSCAKIQLNLLLEEDYLTSDGDNDGETYIYNNPKNGKNMNESCVYVYKKNNRIYAYFQSNSKCEVVGGSIVESFSADSNPFDSNSRAAFDIYNNVIETEGNVDGTKFVSTPTSIPAQEGIGTYTFSGIIPLKISSWYYGDSPSEDETNPVYGTYANVCTEDMIGKYMYVWEQVGYSDGIYGPIKGCENEKPLVYMELTKYQQELSLTQDDYGTSYYFRGDVKNNFINYSGMCWRIVRIQGDGKLKLVLADGDYTCDSNLYSLDNSNSSFVDYFSFGNLSDYESSIQNKLLDWAYRKNLDHSSLAETEWCNDLSIDEISTVDYTNEGGTIFISDHYKAINRLDRNNGNPSLKCDFVGIENSNAKKIRGYIGLLTADEVAFAGGTKDSNGFYYLMDNARGEYLTMTPYWFLYRETLEYFYINSDGNYSMNNSGNIRPAIVLKADLKLKGDGTVESPYEIQ